MTLTDWIIVSAAAAVVVGYIAVQIWKKKTGKGGGCCGCSGCPSASACGGACPSKNPQTQEKQENEDKANENA